MRDALTPRHALLLAAVALAAPAAAQDGAGAFGWFGALAGDCWSATFPDGKTVHRQCYTLQFGRFLRGTASHATLHDAPRAPASKATRCSRGTPPCG